MEFSPIKINFMLACWASPSPESVIWPGGWESPAGIGTREWLRKEGLIDGNNRATERGKAWVEMICTVPLPEDF